MKALVLGASGFCGGSIARTLVARGDDVVALVRAGSEARVPEGARVVVGSVFDPNAIAEAAEGAEVLFSAVGSVAGDLPAAAYRWLHVATIENALLAARHGGVGRVVLVSCSDVTLAAHDRVHWDEKRDIAGEPLGARARAIRLAEEIALSSSDETLSVVALRPGWVWGVGDRSRLPALIREARSTGLRMFGDGRNLVSTTHIDLLAAAAIAAARYPGAAGQAYYLTDAELVELRELFGALSTHLGLPRPVTGIPGPLASFLSGVGVGASPELLATRRFSTHFNAEKARTELGIEATLNLEDGMKALALWVRAEGGVDALAAFVRPPPDVQALSRAAELAP